MDANVYGDENKFDLNIPFCSVYFRMTNNNGGSGGGGDTAHRSGQT